MADKLMPSVQRAYEFAVALYGYGNRFPPIERALRARDLRVWCANKRTGSRRQFQPLFVMQATQD